LPPSTSARLPSIATGRAAGVRSAAKLNGLARETESGAGHDDRPEARHGRAYVGQVGGVAEAPHGHVELFGRVAVVALGAR